MDGRELVGGFLKAEAFTEGFVVVRFKRERMALTGGTTGVQIEQFGRGVTCLFGGPALGLVPLSGAQLMQRGFIGTGAAVAGDQV